MTEKSTVELNQLRRVLIADDHALFRQGLKLVLQGIVDEVSVSEAPNVSGAVELLSDEEPFDLILMDLSMPGMDLTGDFQSFCQDVAPTPVVILSAYQDRDAVTAAIGAGARGYLLKSFSEATLRMALGLILTGEVYVPSSILDSQRDAPAMALPPGLTKDSDSPLELLTRRQRDVLMLVMQGQSNKLIARELGILESTVKAHIQVILQKLNADNRTHAAMIAKEVLQAPDGNSSQPSASVIR